MVCSVSFKIFEESEQVEDKKTPKTIIHPSIFLTFTCCDKAESVKAKNKQSVRCDCVQANRWC